MRYKTNTLIHISDKKCSSSHNFSNHNKPEGLPITYIVNPKQKFNIRIFKGIVQCKNLPSSSSANVQRMVGRQRDLETLSWKSDANELWQRLLDG